MGQPFFDGKAITDNGAAPAGVSRTNALIGCTFLFLLLGYLSFPTQAQDLEPRTYTNIPVGQNFAGVG